MTDRTSAPLTGDQIHAVKQQAAAIARAGTVVIRPGQFVFFATLDSTNNTKDNPAFADGPQSISVGKMTALTQEQNDASRERRFQ